MERYLLASRMRVLDQLGGSIVRISPSVVGRFGDSRACSVNGALVESTFATALAMDCLASKCYIFFLQAMAVDCLA